MKTTMQELIDYINADLFTSAYDIREVAQELLEKEKEQIINSYKGGIKFIAGDVDDAAEYYYNLKYNENK
jgi:hypothetical protein